MKKTSEKKVETSVKELLTMAGRYVKDLGDVLDEFELTHDDLEKEYDRNYQALVMGQFSLQEMVGRMETELNRNIKPGNDGQSRFSSSAQTHPIHDILYLLNQNRLQKFYAVCRKLQGLPGYKLHPSGLVIESVGDLSSLSQESRSEIYRMMRKDFLFRNTKGNIWLTILCSHLPSAVHHLPGMLVATT